jgi:hypothetical protein
LRGALAALDPGIPYSTLTKYADGRLPVACLPELLTEANLRIVVASRPDPPLPADVPDCHPLRRIACGERTVVAAAGADAEAGGAACLGVSAIAAASVLSPTRAMASAMSVSAVSRQPRSAMELRCQGTQLREFLRKPCDPGWLEIVVHGMHRRAGAQMRARLRRSMRLGLRAWVCRSSMVRKVNAS